MTELATHTPEQLHQAEFDVALVEAAHKVDELERYNAEHAGEGTPQWWWNGPITPGLMLHATKHEITPESMASLYPIDKRSRSALLKSRGFKDDDLDIVRFASGVGIENAAKAFSAEPITGEMHQDMLAELSTVGSKATYNTRTEHLDILKEVYSTGSVTDLLAVDSEGYDQEVRQALRNPLIINRMFKADKAASLGDSSAPENYEHEQNIAQEWVASALEVTTGLSKQEARDYAFGVTRYGSGNDDWPETVGKLLEAFDTNGVDRIRELTKETGLHGLEDYTPEQLERMFAFTENPQALAEKLKDQDVTVVMINRFGDHNGIFKGSGEKLDQGDGTLFFEIKTMAEINRVMGKLLRAGIQPSTLILSGHSNEGIFCISDDRDPEDKRLDIASIASSKFIEAALDDSDHKTARGYTYAIDGIQNLGEMADGAMKPSTADGKRKIIFNACYAGSETGVKDNDDEGKEVQAGVESVVSRLAKTLAKQGASSEIDIFGGADGIQMHSTADGLQYTARDKAGRGPRVHLPAVRARVVSGQVSLDTVDEIKLR